MKQPTTSFFDEVLREGISEGSRPIGPCKTGQYWNVVASGVPRVMYLHNVN